jgi:hypothetical protein
VSRICENLSRPEDSAERIARRRILEQIKKGGGCAFCMNRDPDSLAWGRFNCKAPRRTFPSCMIDELLPEFVLDEAKLKERSR